jgi:hypothetical protein
MIYKAKGIDKNAVIIIQDLSNDEITLNHSFSPVMVPFKIRCNSFNKKYFLPKDAGK